MPQAVSELQKSSQGNLAGARLRSLSRSLSTKWHKVASKRMIEICIRDGLHKTQEVAECERAVQSGKHEPLTLISPGGIRSYRQARAIPREHFTGLHQQVDECLRRRGAQHTAAGHRHRIREDDS